MFKKIIFVHNLKAQFYLELILVSAAITVIMIRIFLSLTGYPQLGDSQTLHIAHMLWGGFIMLVVILFFLSFFGRHVHTLVAIIGGAGFGIFIDELGKFITVNNDYFFQPAIPLMYFIFILIFFLGRHFLKTRQPTAQDYLINAVELIQDSLISQRKDQDFYEHVEYLMKKAGRRNRYVKELHDIVHIQKELSPATHVSFALKDNLEKWYEKLLKTKVIFTVVIVFFAFYTFFNAYNVFQPILNENVASFGDLPLLRQLEMSSAIIISFITIAAMIEFIFSRLNSYRTMELAIYLSLFLLQLFIFYDNQLAGIFGLAVSLITLCFIKYFIKMEKKRERRHVLGKITFSAAGDIKEDKLMEEFQPYLK